MNRLDQIRARIKDNEAVILTAEEFKAYVGEGNPACEVDVVTCGTCGVMSGTYAVLSVPVAPPGSFLRADTITLNTVPAIPGPCPNERLGLVDLIVYGTAHGSDTYGGGHLFLDIIADRNIHVEVSAQGKTFETEIQGHELPHARLFTTRSAFKNYTGIINRSSDPVRTIFSVLPLAGKSEQVTVSGCGEINPLENDPTLRHLTVGQPILLNGGLGHVIGQGTRSSQTRPNIAVHGEMKTMDPDFCGGFLTSAGPECITSIGTAIPLIDDRTINALLIRDADIKMPIMDIADRQQVLESSYDRVWSDTSRSIQYHPEACLKCNPCHASLICPVEAILQNGEIDTTRCFNCGSCIFQCPGNVYQGSMGRISLPEGEVPIILRQSDRNRANKLCAKMRVMIQKGVLQI